MKLILKYFPDLTDQQIGQFEQLKGLLNVEESSEKDIIKKSLRHIEKNGTRNWVGYSFAWMGSIYARAKEADSAARPSPEQRLNQR